MGNSYIIVVRILPKRIHDRAKNTDKIIDSIKSGNFMTS
jgi:hypothetical protein